MLPLFELHYLGRVYLESLIALCFVGLALQDNLRLFVRLAGNRNGIQTTGNWFLLTGFYVLGMGCCFAAEGTGMAVTSTSIAFRAIA